VLEVLQPGYMLGERTLRAAMVLVSAGKAAAPSVDVKV
jgi:molecular chaperone GrpE